MCQYKTLYHEVNTGYVIHCNECDRFQVAFSNLVMTFSREDLQAFRKWVVKMKSDQMEITNPHLRCIMIPVPYPGMQLLLSAIELNELVVMLEEADIEFQSLELLNMFQQ